MTYNKVYFEKQQISERKVAVIRGFVWGVRCRNALLVR